MANGKDGTIKDKKRVTYAKNIGDQPREIKISGKWYRWNAMGTNGDTLDITAIKQKILEYSKYFHIYEVEK